MKLKSKNNEPRRQNLRKRISRAIQKKPTSRVRCQRPRIGITMGDPTGIGAEIIAAALKKPSVRRLAQFTIIGDERIFKRYSKKAIRNCSFNNILVDSNVVFKPGKPNLMSGLSSLEYLKEAVQEAKMKKIDALVTAPVSKEMIAQTYPAFTGHTEFLAEAYGLKNVDMMFVTKKLKTVIATRHIPLSHVSSTITPATLFDTIRLTHQSLKNLFNINRPQIGICGLNPHAGERGHMGSDEIQKIIPAIKKARRHKINVQGPFAADTLFTARNLKLYDCIIAMYHDQGLIPVKTLYFDQLVNLTIGLPIIRTSPAHGTAFAIAGKKKADPSSMVEAIKLAARLSS